MPRTVLIDADVIGHINRGNPKAAASLRALIESGARVYISQQAYNELTGQPGKLSGTVGPDLPRTATANKKLLGDLGIKVAPAGKLGDRSFVYERNSGKQTLSETDMMTVAQARSIDAELWSFDKAFRKDPRSAGKAFDLKIAPECQRAYADPAQREDYRTARALMHLAPVEITVGGRVVVPRPSRPPTGSGTPGGQTEAVEGRPGTKAVIGTPDEGPLDVGPTVTRGAKIGEGVVLAISGVNFIVQLINDAIQRKRFDEQWVRVKPHLERHLAEDPSTGALILIRFGRRKKQGAEHESPLEYTNEFLSIDVSYGATESEALENYALQPRISAGAGLEISTQRSFIPPRMPVDVRKLRTPFTSYGVGTFARGKASLMKVEWKGIFGFDEIGDVNLKVPDGETPRFLLLIAPNEIAWFNGTDRNVSHVPLDWTDAAAASVHVTRLISVVNMDAGIFDVGNDTAAMVFPIDAATEQLFDGVARTRDNTGQLRTYVNFDKLRWVRPENIHVLRNFRDGQASADCA